MDLATAHNSNLNIWFILFLNFQLFKNSETATPIDKILVYPNGFICTSGAGTLKNFDAAPGGGYTFQKDLKILIEDKALEYGILDEQQILDMTLSPAGDVVAVATDKRQVFAAKFKELKRSKEDYSKMKPLFYFLHSSPVHGVDICVRKPLVVTCAADRTIRIWNFYNRDCEIWKKFPEEPHSVAIHPNGLYLLSGFTDKLKMMHILNDDIKTVRDLPIRGCREVKFSHGGHLFAAANGAITQVGKYNICSDVYRYFPIVSGEIDQSNTLFRLFFWFLLKIVHKSDLL